MKRTTVSRRTFTARSLNALAALGMSNYSFAQNTVPTGKTVSPETEKANVAIVNDFCAAFGRKDLAKAVSLLADSCVYRPLQTRPPIAGKEKVADLIKGFLERRAEFKVLKTVVLGPIVLNERDDVSLTPQARTYHV